MKNQMPLLIWILLTLACTHKSVPFTMPQQKEYRIPSPLPGNFPYYLVNPTEVWAFQTTASKYVRSSLYHNTTSRMFLDTENFCLKEKKAGNGSDRKVQPQSTSSNFHPAVRIY